jgi:hypothetical protein
MSRGPLDLPERYGRSSVAMHDFFPDLRTWTSFLKDLALNENKSVRMSDNYGSRKRWVCSDTDCGWFVSLSQRRPPKTQRRTKLSAIPAGSWFANGLCLSHKDTCTAVRTCSARKMQNMSGINAAVVDGLNSSRRRVENALQEVDSVDVERQQACVYRAPAAARAQRRQENAAGSAYQVFLAGCEPSLTRTPDLASVASWTPSRASFVPFWLLVLLSARKNVCCLCINATEPICSFLITMAFA